MNRRVFVHVRRSDAENVLSKVFKINAYVLPGPKAEAIRAGRHRVMVELYYDA